VTSSNWDGYYDHGNSSYDLTVGNFNEPIWGTSSCSNNALYLWDGFGGVNTGVLEQAGTARGVPGIGKDEGWVGFVKNNTWLKQILTPLYATEGYGFTVQINYVASGPYYSWQLTNDYTGGVTSGHYNPSSADRSTAEAMLEVPGSYNLPNFSSDSFWAYDGVNGSTQAYKSAQSVWLYDSDGNTLLADTSGYSTGGSISSWTDIQSNCQAAS
jgi:hypothetical protein